MSLTERVTGFETVGLGHGYYRGGRSVILKLLPHCDLSSLPIEDRWDVFWAAGVKRWCFK